ncbi:DegT/DnrJ/EryC1/StrS family aminotransferase [Sphaerisporangium sp. TRM90804]|uniref:DegT/DnrJ/EryC1/StrS family aminotransferase n=1 Tax=Sphaerisporangium sp. TRM90804 TaxID=3031113 RepID=UPI00244A660F|nr:DegT/DnrJ/EryC1/StrS family aminotransferase [Sphaerisporangium sp. TRM90804]MDH2429063.1 DegT/DnrJ/EryC1/StrS family aminotransferase [Sphaerisporangium sp. TRM90804]
MSPEQLVAARTGRHGVYVPSNRLGLFLALRHWCSPGQRLLMSPISADEILFLVLAAGLIPVMAPVSLMDGNIELARVVASAVDAILTTNMYGLPEEVLAMAGTGLVMIEDVAHGGETSVRGRPLGTFGAAGVFSLSKHAGAGSGGVVAVEGAAERRALERERDLLLRPGALRKELLGVATSVARNAALRLDMARPAMRVARVLRLQEPRDGHRIPLRPEELRTALKSVPDLAALDTWVRADLHGYRDTRGAVARWYQSRRLAGLPSERDRRLAGVARLAELPTVAPGVLANVDQPLFRVPLLVADRDGAIAALARRGVPTGYLYDPPYDDYAAEFVEPSPDPEPARWWARHVLPVDPMYADRALPVVGSLQPAPPPPGDHRMRRAA